MRVYITISGRLHWCLTQFSLFLTHTSFFLPYSPAQQGHEGTASKLVSICSPKDYEAVVSSSGKTMVKFWAEWCGKCRMIAPLVEELAGKHPGVKIGSFQTTEEKLEGLAGELGVKTLPQFAFFKVRGRKKDCYYMYLVLHLSWYYGLCNGAGPLQQ
jgi:thioredoxin 1